jgi:hypothetical protein
MPIEIVPESDLTYYLISYDSDGHERTNDPDGMMSVRASEELVTTPVTDVFLISHGWLGDIPWARHQYNTWIRAMDKCKTDKERIRQARPGFKPLLIGLHWPSLPWGEEELQGAAVSFEAPAGSPVEDLIEGYGGRIADTPAALRALRTIFTAAEQDVAPPTLPPEVQEAYAVLDQEASLGSEGGGSAPGKDREPFNAEQRYQAAQEEAVALGVADYLGGLGGLLSPLRQLSFWKMKDRACRFGESGGHTLLKQLQAVRPEVRFHLMGHSFGCIVVSAAVAGPPGGSSLDRPVDSLALAQGAFSLWSYCPDIPSRHGRAGYFHPIIADRRVAGPIITTQSEFDTAVGKWYPLGAGAARQIDLAPGELPRYGAVGTYGLRGLAAGVEDLQLLPAEAAYGFKPGTIYNLESSRIIRAGGGSSGAHSDIAHSEVAHAVWEAARW